MYQYNSIMSAVDDFIDEVNESDANAKLIKPHTIKEAYELLAGYYGKESGAELLAEYESGKPHDVADATKLLLDVITGRIVNIPEESENLFFYYITDGELIRTNHQNDYGYNYIECQEGLIYVPLCCEPGRTISIHVLLSKSPFTVSTLFGDFSYEEQNTSINIITLDNEEYYYYYHNWYNPIPTQVIRSNFWPWYDTNAVDDTTKKQYIVRYAYMIYKNGRQIALPDRD